MKILNILIICPVSTLQAFASSGCKFWPYWNGCDTTVERSCCNVLESIFGGGCPQLCKGESCSGLSQKIRNWCDLTKNNTYMGMSCADETNKPYIKILHSCCESNHSGNGYCKGETTNHCYGLFGADELEVTIDERKTCCSEGYSGRTCSGYFIEGEKAEKSTAQTTKTTTTKPTTTTKTEEPTSTTLPATTTTTAPSTAQVTSQDKHTTTTSLPDTAVVSTTRSEKGTGSYSNLTPKDQTSQGVTLTNTLTLVGGVVGGLLGGILVVLVWWSCRRRRQVFTVQREMTPMTSRAVVVPDLINMNPLSRVDQGYSNPYEEILGDSPVLEPIYSEADSSVLEPRYTEARDFQNYLLAGGTSQTSQTSRGTDGEETSPSYFVLETI